MRKIIANGQTMTPDGQFYLILEQLEDGTIVELMNESLVKDKEYPQFADSKARATIVNQLFTSRGESELTQEEIDFMISYRPGDLV
jgi:hypothetical protein